MAQASKGRIEIFEDFIGGEDIVANTAASRTFGTAGLRVIGQGIAETDSGIVLLESDGLNGVGRLTTTNEDAHSIGLTTASFPDSTELDLDDDAVAGEFDVLRLEVGNNGTARWFVNGVLKKTQAGAVSTTTDLAVLLMVATYGAAIETVDVDYISITANRDWTV
jgi:hypothetical protein